MSPTRTTSPPYRNKLAGSQGFEPMYLSVMSQVLLPHKLKGQFGGLYWIPTSHRSIGILPDSDYRLLRTQGTPTEPLSLQVLKLVDLVGIEPTGPKSTVLQTAEANHIAHKIQNLVCPEGFEPSTTWFQTKYATRLRYGQRLPVTLSGVSTRDFRHSN